MLNTFTEDKILTAVQELTTELSRVEAKVAANTPKYETKIPYYINRDSTMASLKHGIQPPADEVLNDIGRYDIILEKMNNNYTICEPWSTDITKTTDVFMANLASSLGITLNFNNNRANPDKPKTILLPLDLEEIIGDPSLLTLPTDGLSIWASYDEPYPDGYLILGICRITAES